MDKGVRGRSVECELLLLLLLSFAGMVKKRPAGSVGSSDGLSEGGVGCEGCWVALGTSAFRI